MRVDSRLPTTATTTVATGRRAEGAQSFSLGSAPAATGTSAPPAAASLAGLDAVLMLQGESDTPAERRRRTAKRGHDLLDGLDRLKYALLSGKVGTHELRAIAGRLSERASASGDPRLDGLIADIELRAAVELAKLEVSRGV
ncbi:flagellar assembly protein FliX [Methylobacterium trifolii]|nr:flagellar assembly protein FliX [Methylobacterium trifolii]